LDAQRELRTVRAVADPHALRWLRGHFGPRLTVGGPAADGRVDIEVTFPSQHGDPARELCGYAEWVTVTDPPEVREHLCRIGARLVALYPDEVGAKDRRR
jgi:hypothetical protein